MSNPKEQEIASLRAWSESAPYWDKHASTIRAMFEPLSDALIEDAALGPGKSALDVAAGTGEPSLRIAEVCGPSTSVTCTDPVADMIAVAKRETRRRNTAPPVRLRRKARSSARSLETRRAFAP